LCLSTPLSYYSLSFFFFSGHRPPLAPHSFPTRRSSDLYLPGYETNACHCSSSDCSGYMERCYDSSGYPVRNRRKYTASGTVEFRSEEHTSELQSRFELVCRLLLEKKNNVVNRVK